MGNKKENVLSLFINNEDKVSRLYKIYSQKIPANKKMWIDLSKEENRHVEMIEELRDKFGDSNDFFEINKHSVEIVKYVSNFIDSQIKKALLGHVSHHEALDTALRIEQSMVEKKSFEIFKPKNKEIKKVFKDLNKETNDHIKLLRKKTKGK